MINDAINNNVNSFVPDLMFDRLVNNYKMAEQIYGPKLLRNVTGFSPEAIERNVKIPEFQKELKHNIGTAIKSMRREGLIDKEGMIQEDGAVLASLVLYKDEIDKLMPKGVLGEHVHKYIRDPYGIASETRPFRSGDRFSDIDAGKTVKVAIRRGHDKIHAHDLRVQDKVRKGNITVIYAIDGSGSMRGKKIEMCKKAGVALAFKGTQQKNDVGLMVFAADIVQEVKPTRDFFSLLQNITRIQASKETNMTAMLDRAIEVLATRKGTKHLLMLTDGSPTVGADPQKATLHKVMEAREAGITISVVGIQLQEDDESFVRQIADVGGGKLYVVNNLENLDVIVLEDYSSLL